MGATRNNQSRAVTKEKVQQLIQNLLAQGENAFPSERELALRTGGSRGVIRGILEELEKEDRLRQTPNGRIINPQANQIPLLYAAIGRNMVENHAWAKLWFMLSRLAPSYGIKPELVLVGWPEEKALPAIRQIQESRAKYLIVTCHAFFQSLQFDFDSKFTIFSDEDALRNHGHVISLDNREAGRLAARALYEAGYRNPALVTENYPSPYLSFQKRDEGFLEECRNLGVARKEKDCFFISLYNGLSKKEMLQKVFSVGEQIAKAKCFDSLFYITDERVPLLCDTLQEFGVRLPEEMGIISINATDASISYRFPFTTVSVATAKIAEQILKEVARMEREKSFDLKSVQLTPKLHNPETILKWKGKEVCV